MAGATAAAAMQCSRRRAGSAITRAPHQAHYQSRDYNPLHGGIERWFEPVAADIAAGTSLTTILAFCRALFERLEPASRAWHIETHQFRIEARTGQAGKPTPEGMHRDGVDYVLVLLIRRQNIRRGTTSIHDLDRHLLGSFTLTDPFDAALVHDARVYHGVTPVEPVDPARPRLSRRAGGDVQARLSRPLPCRSLAPTLL